MHNYLIEVSFIDKKYKTRHRQSLECQFPDDDESMIKACAIQACIDIYFDIINESVDNKRIKIKYTEIVKF